ncbi:MAG: hypothetical protein FH762_01450 [Firmicutes bacterium]|nr:hypothetical protein [Bacillota bacterium]
MGKNKNGIWVYTIPLPSGTFSYNFEVDVVKKLAPNAITYADSWALEDVAMSQVYVPFDPEYQSDDRSIEMPYKGKDKGTVKYVHFPSVDGREDPLGIYLP